MTAKKLLILIVSLGMLLNTCECFAAVAGAISAEAMLRAKEEFNLSYEQLFDAVQDALMKIGLEFTKTEIQDYSAVLEGRYDTENKFHIYIYKTTDNTSEIEIRVGTSQVGKKKAEKLLEAIRGKIGPARSETN